MRARGGSDVSAVAYPGQVRDLVAEWSSEAFLAEATAWVDQVLVGSGTRRTGPPAPHKVRFWAAVLQVPTDRGRVWFKVANPGQAFEGALLAALGTLAPDRVVAPLATDDVRGWWLLPDGGPTVDQRLADPWPLLMARAADLQREVTGDEAALAMLPRLRIAEARVWVLDVIEDLAHLPTSDPQHLSAADASRLTGGLPALQDDLALLADLGIPETLQPNDVNPRNACGPDEAAALRFFDLGDAFWSHPFAALHLPMRLAAGLDLAAPLPSAPAAVRVAEAYLARWPEAPRRRWAAVVRAADRLGAVHRAASWQRLLAPVDPARLGLPTPRIADWLAAALRPAAGPDLGAAGRGRLPA